MIQSEVDFRNHFHTHSLLLHNSLHKYYWVHYLNILPYLHLFINMKPLKLGFRGFVLSEKVKIKQKSLIKIGSAVDKSPNSW